MRPVQIDNDMKAYALLTAFVFIFFMLVWSLFGIDQYPLDDAYIVEHSVQGLLSGHESRFVDSTPADGITSPVYVGLVTFFAIFMPIPIAHGIINFLDMILLMFGLYKITRLSGLSLSAGLAIPVMSVFAGLTFLQIFNGLETALAMATAAWIIVGFLQDKPSPFSSLMAGISVFIRPELAVLSFMFFLWTIYRRSGNWMKNVLIMFFSFLLCAVLVYFLMGTLIPNTMAAKAYFFAVGCQTVGDKLYSVGYCFLVFLSNLGSFSLGFVFVFFSRLRWIFTAFVLIFVSAYYIFLPDALMHNGSRYVFVMLPFAVYGWAYALASAHHRMQLIGRSFAIVVVLFIFYGMHSGFVFFSANVQEFSKDNEETVMWVNKNLSPQAVLLVQDAGKISLIGQNPLVDLVGLKSHFVVDIHRDKTYAQCGLNSDVMDALATQSRASYIILLTEWNKVYNITTLLQQAGWRVDRADSDRGNSFYQVYKINKNAS